MNVVAMSALCQKRTLSGASGVATQSPQGYSEGRILGSIYRYRAVKITLFCEQTPTVIECIGILGIEPNRLAVIRDSAVSLTLELVR